MENTCSSFSIRHYKMYVKIGTWKEQITFCILSNLSNMFATALLYGQAVLACSRHKNVRYHHTQITNDFPEYTHGKLRGSISHALFWPQELFPCMHTFTEACSLPWPACMQSAQKCFEYMQVRITSHFWYRLYGETAKRLISWNPSAPSLSAFRHRTVLSIGRGQLTP